MCFFAWEEPSCRLRKGETTQMNETTRSLEEARSVIEEEYRSRHAELFPPGAQFARVDFVDPLECPNADWGYSQESDTLRVALNDGDLQDINGAIVGMEIRASLQYQPAWRIYLLHEICHEYQYKVLSDQPDEWGIRACEAHQRKWLGPGHTPAFYSAINAMAACLGVDPEALVDSL